MCCPLTSAPTVLRRSHWSGLTPRVQCRAPRGAGAPAEGGQRGAGGAADVPLAGEAAHHVASAGPARGTAGDGGPDAAGACRHGRPAQLRKGRCRAGLLGQSNWQHFASRSLSCAVRGRCQQSLQRVPDLPCPPAASAPTVHCTPPQELLRLGACLDASCPCLGFTPVQHAVHAGSLATFRVLLDAGANLSVRGEPPAACCSPALLCSKSSARLSSSRLLSSRWS